VLLHPTVYLLLALVHTGVRVARKTYVTDMAGGDGRTEYVAVANTATGALLLGAGVISSVLALLGPEAALVFLALLGAAGVVTARTLPEVSARSPVERQRVGPVPMALSRWHRGEGRPGRCASPVRLVGERHHDRRRVLNDGYLVAGLPARIASLRGRSWVARCRRVRRAV
jgi:hypothetical protein